MTVPRVSFSEPSAYEFIDLPSKRVAVNPSEDLSESSEYPTFDLGAFRSNSSPGFLVLDSSQSLPEGETNLKGAFQGPLEERVSQVASLHMALDATQAPSFPESEHRLSIEDLRSLRQEFKPKTQGQTKALWEIAVRVTESFILSLCVEKKFQKEYVWSFSRNKDVAIKLIQKKYPKESKLRIEEVLFEYCMTMPINNKLDTFAQFLYSINFLQGCRFGVDFSSINPSLIKRAIVEFHCKELLDAHFVTKEMKARLRKDINLNEEDIDASDVISKTLESSSLPSDLSEQENVQETSLLSPLQGGISEVAGGYTIDPSIDAILFAPLSPLPDFKIE